MADNDDQEYDLVEIDTTGMPPEFVAKFKGKLVKQPKAKIRELSPAENEKHEAFIIAVEAHMRRLEADEKKKARGVGNQRAYLKPTTIPPRRVKDTIPMIARVELNTPPAPPVDGPGADYDILSQEQFVQLLEDTMPERAMDPRDDPRKRVTAKMKLPRVQPSAPPAAQEQQTPPSHAPVTRERDEAPVPPPKTDSLMRYVLIGAAAAVLLLGVAWCASRQPTDAHDAKDQSSSSGGAVSTVTVATTAPKPPAPIAMTADPPAPTPSADATTTTPTAEATTAPSAKKPAPTAAAKTAEPVRPEKTAEPTSPKPPTTAPSGPVPMFEREKTP